ncbi:MAG: tetratricopeptide repeat protein [Chloroflexota bacterium]
MGIRIETDNRRGFGFWTWFGFLVLIIGLGILSYATFYNWQKIDMALNHLDFTSDIDIDAEDEDGNPLSEEEIIVARARIALAEAEQAVDLAFNLLGIFEALSLAITIGGVVLTAFGLTNFNNARKDLEETRQSVEEQFQEAQKRVESQFQEARDRFDRAIQDSEEELEQMRIQLEQSAHDDRQRTSDALLANALIPLGERQYKTSDYRGALSTYNRALELDPENPVINQRLGYVYTQTEDYDQAKSCYQTAIDREKDFAPALAGLGYVQRRLGEQVGKQIKDDLPKNERESLMFERDQLFNESERLLQQALKLSPRLVDDDGESYWGILGGLYKRRGQTEQAIEAYKRVVDVTPQSSYGYVNLALLYQKVSDREHALETYAVVEQIASKEAEAEAGNFWGYADLISSSFAIGKDEQALEKLPIALSIAPIDSPFMLESLRATLLDLIDFLDETKIPPIRQAVDTITAELERRKAEAGTN